MAEYSQVRTSQVEHCLRLSNGALPSSEMWIYFIFFLIVRYVGKCCNFVTPKVKKSGNILLLDEISSSLDEETERELYHRLFAVNPQKTIL